MYAKLKIYSLTILILATLCLACASTQEQLDSKTREQLEKENTKIAVDFIDALSHDKSEEAYSLLSEELKATLPIQELEQTWAKIINDSGEFESFSSLYANYTQMKGVDKVQIALEYKFQKGNVHFFLEVSADGYITLFFHQAEPDK